MNSTQKLILATIEKYGPLSNKQLVEHLHLSRVAVGRQIKALCEMEPPKLHRARSARIANKGNRVAIYGLGPGPDAQELELLNPQQKEINNYASKTRYKGRQLLSAAKELRAQAKELEQRAQELEARAQRIAVATANGKKVSDFVQTAVSRIKTPSPWAGLLHVHGD